MGVSAPCPVALVPSSPAWCCWAWLCPPCHFFMLLKQSGSCDIIRRLLNNVVLRRARDTCQQRGHATGGRGRGWQCHQAGDSRVCWCLPVPEPSLSLPTRLCPFTGALGAQQGVPIGTGCLSPACASCHQRCPLRRGWSRPGGCGTPLRQQAARAGSPGRFSELPE